MLATAVAYMENQHQELSRQSADFLDWAKQELAFVETLLRQQQLLDQFLSYRASHDRELQAA
jgi:hypothetical protein